MTLGADVRTAADLLPGAERREVAVEGVRLVVYRAGPARPGRTTPVLLLHGVPETAAHWRDLLPELARDRVVLAVDLPGLGESEVRGPYDVETIVHELAALVLHEVDGPVDLVGHDWGGSIGLALAGMRPDLVRRLVVIAAPYRSINLLRAAHVPFFALPALPEALFRAGGHRVVQLMFRAAWRRGTLDPAVLSHYERAYADPARVAAMLGYYRASFRPRVRGALAAAAHRAGLRSGGLQTRRMPRVEADRHLVVWGAADPVLRVSVGESVVRDLGARTTFVTLPGVGHWPLEEAPDRVVPLVADFLRSADTTRQHRTVADS